MRGRPRAADRGSCLRRHLRRAGGPPALPRPSPWSEVLKLLDERSPRTAADRSGVAVAAADRDHRADAAESDAQLRRRAPRLGPQHGRGHAAPVGGGAAAAAVPPARRRGLTRLTRTSRRKRRASRRRWPNGALEVRRAFASLLSRQEQLRHRAGQPDESGAGGATGRAARAAAGDRSQYDVLRIETRDRIAARAGHERRGRRGGCRGPAGRAAGSAGLVASRRRRRSTSATCPTDVEALWRRPSATAVARRAARAAGRRPRRHFSAPSASGCRSRRSAAAFRQTRDVNGTSGSSASRSR